MTDESVPTDAAPPQSSPVPAVPAVPEDTASGPKVTLLILRILVVLTSVLILLQPFLAGAYLQGQFDALGLHRVNATTIRGLALIQVGAAVAYWRIGRGVAAPVLASLALLALVFVQASFGYGRVLAVHIPLGVAIVGFAVVMIARVCDERAIVGRPPRVPGTPRAARTSRSRTLRSRTPRSAATKSADAGTAS